MAKQIKSALAMLKPQLDKDLSTDGVQVKESTDLDRIVKFWNC